MSVTASAGKGSRYRPVDRRRWEAGWHRIFGARRTPPSAARARTRTHRGP